ncbi:MAG: prephenate dehydratase domain-containing protein, partial [Bifidobacteriaceae bacterium]|nr:prephenate dehydratase domain-containing protein [Bifidobacteriaceae bacterium]
MNEPMDQSQAAMCSQEARSQHPDARHSDVQPSHTLYYLGPRGTFTHQAAMAALPRLSAICDGAAFDAEPADTAAQIFDHVERRDGWGIVAWENNVEGY